MTLSQLILAQDKEKDSAVFLFELTNEKHGNSAEIPFPVLHYTVSCLPSQRLQR